MRSILRVMRVAQGHRMAVEESPRPAANMWIVRLVKFQVLTWHNNKPSRGVGERGGAPGGEASHRTPGGPITQLVQPPGPVLYIYYNLVIKICLAAAEHLFCLNAPSSNGQGFPPNKQARLKNVVNSNPSRA